jgi:hypothetical protein
MTALDNLREARRGYETAYERFEEAIRLARRADHSWAEIAEAAGVASRQHAHRQWRHLDEPEEVTP